MTSDGDDPQRRDVLRAGAGIGLLGFAGLTAAGGSPDRRTGSAQTQRTQNAFSFSLQDNDRFRVRFRPREQGGEPATIRIPADCTDGQGSQEYQILIVRAYRGPIQLGFEGLFVPAGSQETTPGEETTPAEETTTVDEATTLEETTTVTEETAAPAEQTTTEAALQDETTTEAETVTPDGEAPDGETVGAETTTTTEGETAEAETTTVDAETTEAETTTGTTGEQPALPDIRIGEWYRVTSSMRCDDLFRLTLESIEQQGTTPGGLETETETTTRTEPETGTETRTTGTEEETTETEAEVEADETTTET